MYSNHGNSGGLSTVKACEPNYEEMISNQRKRVEAASIMVSAIEKMNSVFGNSGSCDEDRFVMALYGDMHLVLKDSKARIETLIELQEKEKS